jgi:hypothetical protein
VRLPRLAHHERRAFALFGSSTSAARSFEGSAPVGTDRAHQTSLPRAVTMNTELQVHAQRRDHGQWGRRGQVRRERSRLLTR